jgi:hypothetical protein
MLHYVCWEGGNNGSPKTLGVEDVRTMIKKEDVLFARKFDEDSPALDYIDDEIEAGRENC